MARRGLVQGPRPSRPTAIATRIRIGTRRGRPIRLKGEDGRPICVWEEEVAAGRAPYGVRPPARPTEAGSTTAWYSVQGTRERARRGSSRRGYAPRSISSR